MEQRNEINGRKIGIAFISGAAIGATVALMFAPKTGAQTRRRIIESVKRNRDKLSYLPPALKNAYSSATEAARDAFIQAYNESSATSTSMRSE